MTCIYVCKALKHLTQITGRFYVTHSMLGGQAEAGHYTQSTTHVCTHRMSNRTHQKWKAFKMEGCTVTATFRHMSSVNRQEHFL